MFCVSIAFAIDGIPVIGVIDAPFLHQTFSSCRGRGAWLNGTQQLPLIRNPVSPMPENAPSGCTFACEWGKDRQDTPDGNMMRKIDSFINMAAERKGRGGKGGMVHGVRSLGRYGISRKMDPKLKSHTNYGHFSATMDLAYTAMGSFDIWWEGGCWEW